MMRILIRAVNINYLFIIPGNTAPTRRLNIQPIDNVKPESTLPMNDDPTLEYIPAIAIQNDYVNCVGNNMCNDQNRNPRIEA